MAQTLTPNLYNLQGTGITITYSTSSIGGKPQLTLKKGRQTLSFSGNQIDTATTPIGALVTVTIATVPDRGTTTFSFLLPDIALASASGKQAFTTVGVTTLHKTSIAGPVKGAQETYKTIALRGTAQHVEFLANMTAGG